MVNDDNEVVRKVRLVRRKVRKGHTVDCRHRSGDEDMESSIGAAKNSKNACNTATKTGNAVSPINVKEGVKVAKNVSECKSVAKNRPGSDRSSDAIECLQTRSSQATVDIETLPHGELVVEGPYKFVVVVVSRNARSVPCKVPSSGRRSHVSVILRSGVKDADTFDLRLRIQELQAENEDLLPRRAENQKPHMDTLL